MNIKLFQEAFRDKATNLQMLEALRSPDEVGSVLRMHLYLERVIEAWVAAVTDNPKVFSSQSNSFFTFSVKLEIAKNFDLPSDLYAATKMINKLRNDFSHKIHRKIEDIEIRNIEDTLKKAKHHKDLPALTDIVMHLDVNKLSYKECDNRFKFCIICNYIIISLNHHTLAKAGISVPAGFKI
ncbi:hypothetical protein SMKC082_11900 [Serratia marcescens]|uniref:hypothetical protein n=1 Tax=Serratia TaxID=613 RepID=UPI000744F3ED|nr:hypothetical protein [Serratia marcescens]MBN5314241.1 hypothetical protein [Serratia marcescens]CVF31133.1 Uncharacterised protein [Serratia marcescens]BEN77780.1 hypothetical protein SMKC082_11900 [Serratia marcescens]HBC5200748.1 hypothetical protein [Serratia marcescens]HBU6718814.1 hypothetical protein [Serratia marcescens]